MNMNGKTLSEWLDAHKNKLGLLLVLVIVAGFWLVTDRRVSDVENSFEQAYSPLRPYLPDSTKAKIDALLARWDEIEDKVISFEDWLDEQGEGTVVTYGPQTLVYGSDGGDKLNVASGGELEVKSGGTLDLQNGSTNTFAGAIDFSGSTVTNLSTSGATTSTNLIVLGTSDLQDNVSSSVGPLTITDNILVDGEADAVQLTVQGYTTNTNFLFVVEQSDGTDVWRTNVSGQSSSANGAVSFVDDVIVDGAEDTDQLTVQGYTTQTNFLQVWEQSDGTNVATMSNEGALDIESTLGVTGAVTFLGAFYSSFADLAVSDGDTVTPTYTTYALDSSGNVTITLAATGTEGQLLVLIGDDANDITINDTNVRTNDGGVQVINQYDIVMWVYQDAEWVEISESSNS